jgi:paraquat-inducible protein B
MKVLAIDIGGNHVKLGEVLNCRLSDDDREIVIHARIRDEYAPLVGMNSKFWNAGGINIPIGLFSCANISDESAQTLISGSIEFATPPDFQNAATNGAVFSLNEKSEDEWAKWPPVIPLTFVPETMPNKTPAAKLKNLYPGFTP